MTETPNPNIIDADTITGEMHPIRRAVLALGLGGLGVFFWTLRHGQYDDMDGDALRILNDDDKPLETRDGA